MEIIRNMIKLFFILILTGCDIGGESISHKKSSSAENIERLYNEHSTFISPPKKVARDPYPWEGGSVSDYPHITKDYFRCRGSLSNPVFLEKGASFSDCDGRHSLPLINGKEAVYPVLVELLNYIQAKTKKQIVITSGHRCPKHNQYVDRSQRSKTSKHMIGAEADFYVVGLEEKPMEVVNLILQFYKERTKGEYGSFQRYKEKDTDVLTPPWYNKEIFVKLYSKKEGRNFDNRHRFPYISLQVRYDRHSNERVVYSYEKANKGYFRQ